MVTEMKANCILEYNSDGVLLHIENCVGAYTRGSTKESALSKVKQEVANYKQWINEALTSDLEIEIIGEKESLLDIKDADSDIIFNSEKAPLTNDEYIKLKNLALNSAKDFLLLYESICDKNITSLPARKTFYGVVPRTAKEMYEHTKNVNEYYFGEIGVDADNEGDIYACRLRGFEELEARQDYLSNAVFKGSFGEDWSLRKVFRRFIWHDRIHAKAMYRMAIGLFGKSNIANPFYF